MLTRAGRLCALAGAVLVLAVAAAGSLAAEFTLERAGAVNLTSNGKTTFTFGSMTTSCNFTLELELARGPISKVEGASIGSVTNVRWAECEGGRIGAVLGLPWEVTYVSISGTLPSGMTSMKIRILNWRFRFELFFGLVDCLWAGNVGMIMTVSLVRGTTDRYTSSWLRVDENETLSYVSGPEGCPRSGSFSGNFALSATQTLTRT